MINHTCINLKIKQTTQTKTNQEYDATRIHGKLKIDEMRAHSLNDHYIHEIGTDRQTKMINCVKTNDTNKTKPMNHSRCLSK